MCRETTFIDYIFNKGNNTRIRSNNYIRRKYPDHNQEKYLSEASATTRIKLSGDGSNTTCGTRSIFISRLLAESKHASIFNTNTHTNYETIQVASTMRVC